MTEFFEIIERDGPARIGELRFSDPITTPTLADDIVSGDPHEWPSNHSSVHGTPDHLTILPYRGFPQGTDERLQQTFAPEYSNPAFPSAAVITPFTAADHGTDAYILSNSQGIVGHASAFANAIITTRRAIPADTALYLAGVATPKNVASLIYAGVDLVDSVRARIAGTNNRYLTIDAEYDPSELAELPCSCPVCDQSPSTLTRDECVTHNINTLNAAIATARQRIRTGSLRDYIEGQARYEQWCTAVFRTLDQEWAYLEQRTPIVRRRSITATSDDTIHRVEIQRFADRITSRYQNRFDGPLILVPCSAHKPYSQSQSHKQFRNAIKWRGHTVSISSPVGIVPQELELTYPAQHYDTVVTGTWSEEEIAFVSPVLARYLDQNPYPFIIAHVPEGGYRSIVERATEDLDIPVRFTVEDHPTTPNSLANLADELEDISAYSKQTRVQNTIQAIGDYQFGKGVGNRLFDDSIVTDRYPKHRVFAESDEQLATLVPEYGVLALTLAGAKRWVDRCPSPHQITIDDFVPHGSVLAPGVTGATDGIRSGDEVVVVGDRAFGVGRAVMSGPEMTSSSRGVAVEMRHVEERDDPVS